MAGPTTKEVLEKVPEIEVEDMEAVDRDREARLEDVRRKQLQYQALALCRGVVGEMIADSGRMSRTRICMEIMEETLVGGSWEILEVKRLVREIREGGAKRKVVV